MFAPLSIGQHRPAHAPRGRAAKPIASTSCIDPTHKASRCADRSSGEASRAGQRPAGSLVGPAAAAVARALARLRSFLPLPCLTVPRRAGAEIRPRTSPLEEAHAPSTRPWPVKCTGQPTQPSNRRPNAPPIAVPHGSLASSTLTGALRSTRRASSKRGAPLVSLYSKGWALRASLCKPEPTTHEPTGTTVTLGTEKRNDPRPRP